jgi:hypothetical protein
MFRLPIGARRKVGHRRPRCVHRQLWRLAADLG